MKLWVRGGQCDDSYECIPGEQCPSCELRFRCLTERRFECFNEPTDNITSSEASTFILKIIEKANV